MKEMSEIERGGKRGRIKKVSEIERAMAHMGRRWHHGIGAFLGSGLVTLFLGLFGQLPEIKWREPSPSVELGNILDWPKGFPIVPSRWMGWVVGSTHNNRKDRLPRVCYSAQDNNIRNDQVDHWPCNAFPFSWKIWSDIFTYNSKCTSKVWDEHNL